MFRRCFATAAALLVAVGVQVPEPTLGAEVVVGSDGGPALVVGRVLLYPSFVTLVAYTNNLLSVSSDSGPTATWMKDLSPSIVVEAPFSHSLFRVGYDLSSRNYGVGQSRWINTNTAFVDLNLEFGNGAFLAMHDAYRDGILDVRVGDPGAELPFLGQQYRTNTAEVYAGHGRPQSHRFGVRARTVSTTYLPPIVAPYFNESGWWVEPDGEWRTGPRTWIVWAATGGVATLERPDSLVATADVRTQHEISVRAGARWELSRNAALQFLVGPGRQRYEAAVPSTFFGIVGSLAVQNTAVVGTRWSVDLNRDVFASVFEQNNYFVSNQITVRAEMPRGAAVRFGGSTAYYRNAYPTDPAHRVDRSWWTDAWMGIRQGIWIEWRATVRYDVRSSTFPGADYSAVIFGLGLFVGR